MSEQTGNFEWLEIAEVFGVRLSELNRHDAVMGVCIKKTQPAGVAVQTCLKLVSDFFGRWFVLVAWFRTMITNDGRELGLQIILTWYNSQHGISDYLTVDLALFHQVGISTFVLLFFLGQQRFVEVLVDLLQKPADTIILSTALRVRCYEAPARWMKALANGIIPFDGESIVSTEGAFGFGAGRALNAVLVR